MHMNTHTHEYIHIYIHIYIYIYIHTYIHAYTTVPRIRNAKHIHDKNKKKLTKTHTEATNFRW